MLGRRGEGIKGLTGPEPLSAATRVSDKVPKSPLAGSASVGTVETTFRAAKARQLDWAANAYLLLLDKRPLLLTKYGLWIRW